MEKYTSCSQKYSPEAFLYKRKTYKTCANCLANKAKKRIDEKAALSIIVRGYTQDVFESILLKELSNYVAELIESTQENSGLFFKIRFEIFDLVEHSFKSIAEMIINYIESGDNYVWLTNMAPYISTCYDNVSTFYFACLQSNELAQVTIKLSHNILHERPIIVATPIEIKQEIEQNLHLSPIQLRSYLYNKFAKGHFELYTLIENFESTGFPLAYLVLDLTNTSKDTPQDENFSEINAAREVWPKANIQLCLWYIERALKQKLITMKFNFIDPNFIPNLENDTKNYEVCPNNFRNDIINFIRAHFHMHYKIPINASSQYLTPAKIREKANMYLEKIASAWFNNFKKDWKSFASKPIAIDAKKYYTIDSAHWMCNYPFLIWDGNKLLNESSKIYTSLAKNCESKIITTNENSRNIDIELHQKCEFEIITTNENSENIDPELHQEYDSKIASLEHLVKHLKEELSVNNLQHVENVVNNMKHTFTIIDDIEKSQNKRSCSTTWHGAKPWTMFL
ncbi:9293_t:CDS:2 [Gigaspora margarita]|uniref:9293_t:CDS:1 n=1 Tax=Gigaspora margarita TaxID=4874 RepID=A0ABN7V0J7_GIGMA|nr:9293_t:CDS:2 [Gigaspora margarita]